jgi:hypothetical protein
VRRLACQGESKQGREDERVGRGSGEAAGVCSVCVCVCVCVYRGGCSKQKSLAWLISPVPTAPSALDTAPARLLGGRGKAGGGIVHIRVGIAKRGTVGACHADERGGLRGYHTCADGAPSALDAAPARAHGGMGKGGAADVHI